MGGSERGFVGRREGFGGPENGGRERGLHGAKVGAGFGCFSNVLCAGWSRFASLLAAARLGEIADAFLYTTGLSKPGFLTKMQFWARAAGRARDAVSHVFMRV
jgi:hypothetical protein